MSSQTKQVIIIVVVALAFGLTAGAATYYFQQQKIDRLEAALSVQDALVEKLNAKSATLSAQIDQLNAEASVEAADGDTKAATPSELSEVTPKTLRQFAFVTKATENGGDIKLTLDYAEFLTGDAAATAAAAAGDESPPPNDYYISNTNTKLRVLPVASTAKFTIAGGDPTDTTVLSAGQFLDAIINNTDGAADVSYWFTIKSGVVTGGEEQWTP